jgi:Gamma-butyrobetaine hydroxylase-like, N-terminal
MFSEIELELPGGEPFKLDLFWLRDHCRCDKCYDHSTYQRKSSVLDIPDDISTQSHKVQGEKLNVICKQLVEGLAVSTFNDFISF